MDWIDTIMDLSIEERIQVLQEQKQHRENKRTMVEQERQCKWLGT